MYQKEEEKKNTDLPLVNLTTQDKSWPVRTMNNILFDEISTNHQHQLLFVMNKGSLH